MFVRDTDPPRAPQVGDWFCSCDCCPRPLRRISSEEELCAARDFCAEEGYGSFWESLETAVNRLKDSDDSPEQVAKWLAGQFE